ncbi:MAG: hypothetical protein R3C17_20865 [Planctomycetaceae bacterium]
MPGKCPDLRLLIDFYLGKLDEEAMETIFVHLEICDSCEKLLEQIENKHPVPFLQKLRSMNLTTDRAYLHEPEFQQALQNLPTVIDQSLRESPEP